MKFESHKFYPQTLVFYLACLLGMIFFAIVTYVLNQENGPLGKPPYQIWNWIASMIGLIGVLGSDFVYNWLIRRLPSSGGWDFRSRQVRLAMIIRFLMLEITAMVAGVAFMISGNMYSFLIMILIIAYTLLKKPSRESLIELTHASKEEQELI